VVGVVPGLDDDVGKIYRLRLLAFAARGAKLLLQGNVPFNRGFVEQLRVGLKKTGELLDVFFGDWTAGVCLALLGDFSEGALAIKQLDELPLEGSEAEHQIGSGHLYQHHRLPLLDVLFRDYPGIQLRGRAPDDLLRHFGKCDIKRANNIHGAVGKWTSARMPGFKPDVSPFNSARMSMVPLEGSITGLT